MGITHCRTRLPSIRCPVISRYAFRSCFDLLGSDSHRLHPDTLFSSWYSDPFLKWLVVTYMCKALLKDVICRVKVRVSISRKFEAFFPILAVISSWTELMSFPSIHVFAEHVFPPTSYLIPPTDMYVSVNHEHRNDPISHGLCAQTLSSGSKPAFYPIIQISTNSYLVGAINREGQSWSIMNWLGQAVLEWKPKGPWWKAVLLCMYDSDW